MTQFDSPFVVAVETDDGPGKIEVDVHVKSASVSINEEDGMIHGIIIFLEGSNATVMLCTTPDQGRKLAEAILANAAVSPELN